MYLVKIIEPGCTGLDEQGKIVERPVGTIIYAEDAWQLCCTNSVFHPRPLAEPCDDITAEKVRKEKALLDPRINQERELLQVRVNSLAEKNPAAIDKATGTFKRNAKGEFDKALDAVGVFVAELAEKHGIVPVIAKPAV